ncbi:hypothetical protein AB1Y20_007842 [Prymnesium parvum]|uniref:Uncharacterized protein n=1 Tax=Prymnesium parvum TaxID=97485 RepID=A0AB34IUY6_PRYPA
MADDSDAIPGRMTVLLSSWVFIFASIFLLAEFIAIHEASPTTCNVLGTLSDLGWAIGFILLIDWLVFHIFPAFGASRRALTGATLKLIASVLFLLQPVAGLLAPSYGLPGVGIPWSNLVGILFFHAGNCVDAVGMCFSFDTKAPLAWWNWPALGMWVYCAATWLLVAGNAIFFFSIAAPWGPGVDVGGAAQHVEALQEGGASLLLIGSVIYTAWASRAREMNTQTDTSPMISPLAYGSDP